MVKASETVFLKKAKTAYMCYMGAERENIMKKHDLKAIGDVAKKVGELWNQMGEKERKPYVALAEQDKIRYAKDVKSGLVAAPRKSKKDKTEKKKKDPNAPKRPMSAYFLWMNENRAKIVKDHGLEGKISEVAKKAGEIWGTMSEKDKKPYDKKAADAKAAYTKAMEKYNAEKADEDEESDEE